MIRCWTGTTWTGVIKGNPSIQTVEMHHVVRTLLDVRGAVGDALTKAADTASQVRQRRAAADRAPDAEGGGLGAGAFAMAGAASARRALGVECVPSRAEVRAGPQGHIGKRVRAHHTDVDRSRWRDRRRRGRWREHWPKQVEECRRGVARLEPVLEKGGQWAAGAGIGVRSGGAA